MKVVEQVDFHFNHSTGVTGVPGGLKDLDEKTGGFQDADLMRRRWLKHFPSACLLASRAH
jgi:replicative DNA helicase